MKQSIHSFLFLLGVIFIPFDIVFPVGIIRCSLTEVLLTVAMLIWFAETLIHRRGVNSLPYIIPFVVFMVAWLLSAVYALRILVVLRETAQFAWLICLTLYVANQANQRHLFTLFVRLLMAGGVVAAIWGIYQYFTFREPVDFLISEARVRAFGFFDQPNTMGNFLAGSIPIVTGLYLTPLFLRLRSSVGEQHSSIRKIVVDAVFFIFCLGLLVTFSRGSWIGAVAGMISFCVMMRKTVRLSIFKKPILIAGLACLVVIIDMSWQESAINRSFSNRQRILLANAAVSMFKDYPLTGVGSGNFQYRLQEYTNPELDTLLRQSYDGTQKKWYYNPHKVTEVELAHNVLLQVIAETGLMGTIAFISLFGLFFLQSWNRIKGSVSTEERVIRVACFSGVIALFGSGMFGWPFSHGVQELLMIAFGFSSSSEAAEASW